MDLDVPERWYKDMMCNFSKCRLLHENGQQFIDSAAFKAADADRDRLLGFLSGLESFGYITSEQCFMYRAELLGLADF